MAVIEKMAVFSDIPLKLLKKPPSSRHHNPSTMDYTDKNIVYKIKCNPRYKTALCRNIICPYTSECNFAHGRVELDNVAYYRSKQNMTISSKPPKPHPSYFELNELRWDQAQLLDQKNNSWNHGGLGMPSLLDIESQATSDAADANRIYEQLERANLI